MFEFKEPIIIKNEELLSLYSEFENKHKNMFISEASRFDKILMEDFKQTFEDFATKESLDFMNNNFYSKVKGLELLEEFKEKLMDNLVIENDDFVWFAKVYCPYTNILIKTEYIQLSRMEQFRKTKKVPLIYIMKGLDNTVKVPVTFVSEFNYPKLEPRLLSDVYSSQVIKLFKKEWSVKVSRAKKEDFLLKSDDLIRAEMYYPKAKRFVSKKQGFDLKRGRFVQTPYGIKKLISNDIENFEDKLNEILKEENL